MLRPGRKRHTSRARGAATSLLVRRFAAHLRTPSSPAICMCRAWALLWIGLQPADRRLSERDA
jgi:hypothetical protein